MWPLIQSTTLVMVALVLTAVISSPTPKLQLRGLLDSRSLTTIAAMERKTAIEILWSTTLLFAEADTSPQKLIQSRAVLTRRYRENAKILVGSKERIINDTPPEELAGVKNDNHQRDRIERALILGPLWKDLEKNQVENDKYNKLLIRTICDISPFVLVEPELNVLVESNHREIRAFFSRVIDYLPQGYEDKVWNEWKCSDQKPLGHALTPKQLKEEQDLEEHDPEEHDLDEKNPKKQDLDEKNPKKHNLEEKDPEGQDLDEQDLEKQGLLHWAMRPVRWLLGWGK